MQARKDPGQGGGKQDMAPQLSFACAQHARIVEKVSIDLAHPLICTKENDEKDQRESKRNLGALIYPEDEDKNRRQDQPGQSVQDLDIGTENSRPEVRASEKEACSYSKKGAQDKACRHLLQRDGDVLVDGPSPKKRAARVGQPLPHSQEKLRGTREEKRVDQTFASARFPTGNNDRKYRDLYCQNK